MRKTLRGQTAGTFKTQSLDGIEYLVVPVIAMIEGVRLGAAQDSGELGLATEFGKFPEGWNTKPVVMNHPKDGDNFVSAGQPKVLEKYQFGSIFNTHLDGKKLKMEAWLNKAMASKSDTIKRVFERVEAEELIEVSVGFFTEVEEEDGEFKGLEYTGIWRNVMPDHLAFLEEGTIGACSVEDGCGTPRVNKGTKMFKKKKKTQEKGKLVANCECTDPTIPAIEVQKAVREFVSQSIADELLSGDIMSSLNDALGDMWDWCWVIGYTNTVVIYSAYDGSDWDSYQQTFDIDANGAVTLTGEPQEVRLITKIVPAADTDNVTTNQSKENDMTKVQNEAAAADPKAAAPATTETAAPAAAEVKTETPAAETKVETQAAKTLTAQEYIDNAPEGIAEVLKASLNMMQKRKDEIIANLKATNRCQLGEVFLKAQPIEVLENLAALAQVPQNYAGIAAAGSGPRAQESEVAVQAAPKVFEVKTA
jgi:hypothetical protein